MECKKRHTNSIPRSEVKEISLAGKKRLGYGSEVYLPSTCGHLVRVKINGKPKTWVRSPNKVEVPFKYGLYEHGYIRASDKAYKPK
jgi:hypothetical protein